MEKLLEEIVERLDCLYISDIAKANRGDRQVGNAVLNIDVHAYSLKEWNEAVSYITGEKQDFASVIEAKTFLLHY